MAATLAGLSFGLLAPMRCAVHDSAALYTTSNLLPPDPHHAADGDDAIALEVRISSLLILAFRHSNCHACPPAYLPAYNSK